MGADLIKIINKKWKLTLKVLTGNQKTTWVFEGRNGSSDLPG